ncbi:MBL fold metallo-hydrolase [Spirillospora sp. CA-294931]|uniref:MBL fold metallo-hydrolase n=1 Tax=Spirillospora sp. CA-294931 TaxID=3240042 RepID=UPI003D910A61
MFKDGAVGFWSGYTLGMFRWLPQAAVTTAREQSRHIRDFTRTRRRRFTLVDDHLELWFLGAPTADLVPLLFGERFAAVWYRGVLIDPGSVRMRRSLRTHLTARPVTAVTATHAHEEHTGNLRWAADRLGASLHLSASVTEQLRAPARLPPVRDFAFGTPAPITGDVHDSSEGIPFPGGRLDVIPAPGHSSDHVVLHDREQRVLLVGDTFIDTYFSASNNETDGTAWMATLRHLLTLDFDLMVEGHGRVHTLRPDVPDLPGVVVREDPRRVMEAKLHFLQGLSDRAQHARARGLSVNRAVAEAFPWEQRPTWERLIPDELARLTSLGEFSRHRLIRSFLTTQR